MSELSEVEHAKAKIQGVLDSITASDHAQFVLLISTIAANADDMQRMAKSILQGMAAGNHGVVPLADQLRECMISMQALRELVDEQSYA